MNFIVVAFYTKGTPYEEEINNLRTSIKRLGLKSYIKGIDNRGEWVENAGAKPEIILEATMNNPGKNILYVDADAVIHKIPDFSILGDADIGLHYKDGKELLSGTIMLRNNKETHHLLREWIEEQFKHPRTWDQKTLVTVLKRLNVVVKDLPREYCQIFDTMRGPNPVIEHFQASRRFKSAVRKAPERHIVPDVIDNIRVRHLDDGSFLLARCKGSTARKLDNIYVRCPNEFRWFIPTHFTSEGRNWASLKIIFNKQWCHLIGKGPSLDQLDATSFPDSDYPIIAINEAIHKVVSLNLKNPIFGIQQDKRLEASCRPAKGNILISHHAKSFYANFDRKYIYIPEQYIKSAHSLSAEIAVKIALSLGCRKFHLHCFDAMKNRATDYAKCIGHGPGECPERFLDHGPVILRTLEGHEYLLH
jgi:hypothetical protein